MATATTNQLSMAALQGDCALPLLASPGTYDPCTFDWLDQRSPISFQQWVEVFRKSIPGFKRTIAAHPTLDNAQERAAQFAQCFEAICDAVVADPTGYPVPGCSHPPCEPMRLCALREMCLVECGIEDAFSAVKSRENAAALRLLPAVLAEVDAAQGGSAGRYELLLRGVFAGNVFDLGAAASTERFESGQASFHSTRDELLPRPWAVDDYDEAVAALAGGRAYDDGVVIMFIDNAGSDCVLGMLPLAREILRSHPGCTMVLAANERPSINDMTARELESVLYGAAASLGKADALSQAWSSGRLRVVSSGSGLPVIDLRRLSHELAEVAAGAKLVVLEGMGRAVETNLRVQLTCDCLRLGMIKHPEVAQAMNARLYDCVCKFDQAN